MKKHIILFSLVLFGGVNKVLSQDPYAHIRTIQPKEARLLVDPIPIDKGEEQKYYAYALSIFNQGSDDSLLKAGQIFDRLYWLDTLGEIGKNSLKYRISIETQIKSKTNEALFGLWLLAYVPPAPWSGLKKPRELTKPSKKIIIANDKIMFYLNDTLTRTTTYSIRQQFNWQYGVTSSIITYSDDGVKWYYGLSDLFALISDELKVQLVKDGYNNNEYVEVYKRDKKL
jgi:hypothetical protein